MVHDNFQPATCTVDLTKTIREKWSQIMEESLSLQSMSIHRVTNSRSGAKCTTGDVLQCDFVCFFKINFFLKIQSFKNKQKKKSQ